MKSQELIKLLEEHFSINDFAIGEFSAPHTFRPENIDVKNITRAKSDALRAMQKHPGYNNHKYRDKGYENICNRYRDLPTADSILNEAFLESLGIGPIKEVEQYGGEGQGDTWYSIKYFPKFNIYLRVDGHYTSYDGTDFYNGYGDVKEVTPKQKTITVFE